jgi:hypothetical protein
MPISSKDFDKSDRESNLMLIDFLRAHPLDAYSLDELTKAMAAKKRKLSRDELTKMLMLMEYGRKVTSRKLGGVTYYRYREFLGYTPPTGPI